MGIAVISNRQANRLARHRHSSSVSPYFRPGTTDISSVASQTIMPSINGDTVLKCKSKYQAKNKANNRSEQKHKHCSMSVGEPLIEKDKKRQYKELKKLGKKKLKKALKTLLWQDDNAQLPASEFQSLKKRLKAGITTLLQPATSDIPLERKEATSLHWHRSATNHGKTIISSTIDINHSNSQAQCQQRPVVNNQQQLNLAARASIAANCDTQRCGNTQLCPINCLKPLKATPCRRCPALNGKPCHCAVKLQQKQLAASMSPPRHGTISPDNEHKKAG